MSFSVGPIPQGAKFDEFVSIVWDRLQQIEQEFYFLQIPRVSTAPVKPLDGQLSYADGTLWNPGSGRGAYMWDSGTGAWRFLG